MYLNMNLGVPPGEGNTPKTPEILNSLISLTCPPSYTPCHTQVTGDLLSPVSSVSTPGEETKLLPHVKRHCSGSSSDGGSSSSSLGGGSPGAIIGGCGPLVGATPPATPDLPSPVMTVLATKTALIKEGLKHQIKSKLQAAGMGQDEILLDSKMVKEELTNEDSERRRRRRERNKIAATKCRNKKKEKTFVLLSSLFQESEQVEDQNCKLKNEIQRLKSEKLNLEKLLGDPGHKASCRYSCSHQSSVEMMDSKPLVVISPSEDTDCTSVTSAVIPQSSPPSVVFSACSSPQYCSSPQQQSSSSSSLSLHSGSYTLVSSSKTGIPTDNSCVASCSSISNNNSTELTTLSCSSKCLTSLIPSHCIPSSSESTSTLINNQHSQHQHLLMDTNSPENQNIKNNGLINVVVSPSLQSPSEFSNNKIINESLMLTHQHQQQQQQQQYDYSSPQQHLENNYNVNSQIGSISTQDKQFCSQLNANNLDKYQYGYHKMETNYSNNEFTPPNPPTKSTYLAPKSRAPNMTRYHPYNCAGRIQNVPLTDSHNNNNNNNNNNSLQQSVDQFDPCNQQRLDYVPEQQANVYYSYL